VTWAYKRAGDGNRTRTVSLGICAGPACTWADLRRSNFTRTWRKVTVATELTGFHFHDLRHTGNMLAAATGASLRELMDRMGHSTTRAALIYLHSSGERDRLIAAGISTLADAERGSPNQERARSGHEDPSASDGTGPAEQESCP